MGDSQSFSPTIHFLSCTLSQAVSPFLWINLLVDKQPVEEGEEAAGLSLSPVPAYLPILPKPSLPKPNYCPDFHQLTRMACNGRVQCIQVMVSDLLWWAGLHCYASRQKILWTMHFSGCYHDNLLGGISGQDSMDEAGCIFWVDNSISYFKVEKKATRIKTL